MPVENEYTYTYLLMGMLFFLLWGVLFLYRKDTRKELLVMSTIFAIVGPIAEYFYIQDWWTPQTITKTAIGIEDMLFGFVIGGVTSVLYEDIFKKRLRKRKGVSKKVNYSIRFVAITGSTMVIFLVCFFLFNLNTLYSTILSALIPTIYIWIKRKDLIADSVATGIILVIVTSLVYTILEYVTPGWIQEFWIFENTPNIVILNLPIDDIFWYFFVGMLIGPLYEFWQEKKLVKA